MDVSDSKSEATYDQLFRRHKKQGLRGVQLVTSDDPKGMVRDLHRPFQDASWQRCQVHFLRNAPGKVARKHTADRKAILLRAGPGVGAIARSRGGGALEWIAGGKYLDIELLEAPSTSPTTAAEEVGMAA